MTAAEHRFLLRIDKQIAVLCVIRLTVQSEHMRVMRRLRNSDEEVE